MKAAFLAGFGNAGLRRFPSISQVFNVTKTKKLEGSEDKLLGLKLLEKMSYLVNSKGQRYAVENDKLNTKRKAMLVTDAIRQLRETDSSGRLVQVKRVRKLINSVQRHGSIGLTIAWLRTDLSGQMSLVMDLNTKKQPDSKYTWVVVLCRRLRNIEKECAMLNSRFRMHFLPPLDQLEALQMPPNADRHEGLDMELEYLSQLWNAGQSEEVQKDIIGTIVAVGKHLDNRVLFKVDIHGSRLYGLCKSNSDFDIIANVRVPRGALEDSVFMGFIKRFTARLQAQRGFSRVIWLKRARVPIIKFHYRTQSGEYEGDISFNNGIGQSKAQLIMRYMEADPRVRLFLILVKNWGVERMICDSNVMNSFGLLMMALTFLIQERVVPPLQLLSTFRATQKTWDNLHLLQASPEAISQLYSVGESQPAMCLERNTPLPYWTSDGHYSYFFAGHPKRNEWQSPNKKSAFQLVFEMFKFYGSQFDPINHAISPRLGTARIPRTSLCKLNAPTPQMYIDQPQQWKQNLRLLAIEDPFELTVNCGRNAPPEWVEGLLWEMRRAAVVMSDCINRNDGTAVLHRLFTPPSASVYCDASVWASAYSRLLPLLQESINEHVYDPNVDLNSKTTIGVREI
ncbi:hypothetical protein LPJ78_003076 [Coemansia sp. RSA 989]|nr:hypothetical protein BX667DRAFT_515736 [Coemansia mojavensis]KAJ1743146.1 hypothetical protein LPJ68_001265 [Coemansia sp. RSA 1086]KAJ1753179.1 hypothetical protein LPJ79_000632 [Coemansia sp. RSA 1821]KAJ1864879.1 hypothetical protein LPJ78_003076 [Coemansia sp. RSA 989]KAJ1872587.1 hypothetical protein LPJ55_002974 [Coemansia sp. RSA 990]KAJ2650093.1 hypothetical protein IWW40_002639 [Coemansia sp. RSA 1250]KAJ2674657.1 hypothetical protein IWW42_001503 [Coemansia sp. RSA 1085]